MEWVKSTVYEWVKFSMAIWGVEEYGADLPRELRIRVFPTGHPPQAPDCSPPDIHRKLRIRVFPTGPTPQAQDQSVPRRTYTIKCSPPDLHRKLQAQHQRVPRRTYAASSGSKCSPPNLRCESKCSPPDLNHKEPPKIYQIECQKICHIQMPEIMS